MGNLSKNWSPNCTPLTRLLDALVSEIDKNKGCNYSLIRTGGHVIQQGATQNVVGKGLAGFIPTPHILPGFGHDAFRARQMVAMHSCLIEQSFVANVHFECSFKCYPTSYSLVTTMKRSFLRFLIVSLMAVGLVSCADSAEEIDIGEVMPEGFVKEVMNAYPEFKAQLVSSSETGVAFGDKYLEVEGIEDSEVQSRLANHVLSYLENPKKKAEQAREREE